MSVEVSHIASRVHRLASPSEARTWLTRLCQEPSICQREGLSQHQKLELQLTSFDASATFWLMPRGQALKTAASPGAFRRLHARLPESAFDTAARDAAVWIAAGFLVNARRNTRLIRPVASKCSSHTISPSFVSASLAERGADCPERCCCVRRLDHPICSQALRCFQFERPV